jgi:rfaE bifunctional protein nucleotidyltransferase chain/domain
MLTNLADLLNQRVLWRQQQKTVVFTNGVFDLLHRGHIEYLNSAQALGDILVIGLNDDASVERLKGPLRPILSITERAFLLANLKAVDAVVSFSEDTPRQLISTFLPDILVKGGDYSLDEIIGADEVIANGGKVLPLQLVPGKSSTNIIETIINRYCKDTK